MKGLILSGGRGTRLRPITHTRAKQLIPVANKPVLFYGIEAIRDAGIDEIGIIVGDTQNEIRRAVGDGSAWGIRITYIHQAEPLGLAHAVLTAREFIGDSPFVMYLGDNLILDGISRFIDEFREKGPNCQVLLAKVDNPSQFGVAVLEESRIVQLYEKPVEPPSDLALVGVYLFDENIFRAAEAIEPSARGELEITDAIQWLIEKDYQVESHVISGWWKDTGKLNDLLEANRMLLDQVAYDVRGGVDDKSEIASRVVIEEGAVIKNSIIRGPVIIGENSRIIDSYIGPYTSIHNGCLIENSEMEHSIVLSDSCIKDVPVRIEDSLIGCNVHIGRTREKPKVLRFMLGDNSSVGII